MPSVLLLGWSLQGAIKDYPGLKLTRIAIPQLDLQVECNFTPDGYALVTGNPRLSEKLHEICKGAYTKRIPTIAWQLQTCDAQCGKGNDLESVKLQNQTMQQINRELENAYREAVTGVNDYLTNKLKELPKQKQQVKLYVLGIGVKAVKAGVGGVTSAFALAAGPVGALGIIGLYRALVEGGELISNCIEDAKSVQDRVEKGLKALDESYKKATGVAVGRELLASAVNAVVSPPSAFTMPNIGTLEEAIKLWGNKLTRLDLLADDLAGKLQGLLDACDELKARLVSDPDSSKKKAALGTLEKNVGLLLDHGYFIPSMMRRVTIPDAHQAAENGLEAQKQAKIVIEDLKAKRPIAVDAFDKIIKVVTQAGLMIASPPQTAMDIAGFANDCTSLFASSFGIGYELPAEHFERKVREIEENEKKELELAMTRPRSNAIGSMADAKARSIAAGKARP